MAMVVKNNLSAVRTLNILNSNSSALQKGMARVSSGMKITGAQDDAAGFAISERMRVRIRALDQANQNSQNDSSLMKTAEGAVGNTIDILKALKEKCINAANDSNTDEDRQTIQKEIDQYIDQIDDNAQVTFNGKSLVDGTKNNAAVATKTILLNQNLKVGTLASDLLTSYKNRVGDSLGIQETDYYQVSWVENGNIHTTSGQVGTKSLSDILSTPDANGATLQATVAATGTDGKIGTTETSRTAGYTSAFTFEEQTELSSAQVISKLGAWGINGGTDSVVDTPLTTGSLNGTDLTITGYKANIPDSEGNPNLVDATITVKQTTSTTGSERYSITITDANGDPLKDASGAVVEKPTLYKAVDTAASKTAVDSTGAPVSAADAGSGYLDAPTAATNKLNNTTYTFSSGAWPTEFLNFTGELSLDTTADAVNDMSTTGYYIKSGNSYVAAKGTITIDSGGNNANVSGDNNFVGQQLYKFNTETPGEIATISGGNSVNSKLSYKVPGTITVDTISDEKEVADKYNKDVYTPDNTQGLAVVAKTAGVDEQISGLTISILDQDLNVKKSANAALDQFKQYQRAENKTGDNALNFHLGSEANQAIKVGFSDMRAQALGLKGADGTRINVYTKENANASINVIENALTKALDQQTTIGAVESRLEYTSANLTTASENVQASESTIRDADMAKEMTNYTKANVLLQAAQAMLAQANQSSSSVLSLLQ